MSFKKFLTKFKSSVDTRLNQVFEGELNIAKKANDYSFKLIQMISEMTLNGGKRLRPFLVYLGYNLNRDNLEISEDLLNLATSVELFQTFCLIHDDIMDESLIRRGQPTIEKKYQLLFEKKFDPKKTELLARNGAILAGDLAFALSNSVFGLMNSANKETSRLFWLMQREVCYGQLEDALGLVTTDISNLEEARIMKMMEYKTGRYSVEKPLSLGASLANLGDEQKAILSEIGLNLGVAFQITDDLLGIFGNQESIGKPIISDLQEGKRTLILLNVYHLVEAVGKQKLETILETGVATEDDLEWFKGEAEKLGVRQKLTDFSQKLVTEAQQKLTANFPKTEAREALLELSEYLIAREV